MYFLEKDLSVPEPLQIILFHFYQPYPRPMSGHAFFFACTVKKEIGGSSDVQSTVRLGFRWQSTCRPLKASVALFSVPPGFLELI